ncbi:MAG: ATPase, T2SS/T4P/T4SS family [Halobacteriales archaeon]
MADESDKEDEEVEAYELPDSEASEEDEDRAETEESEEEDNALEEAYSIDSDDGDDAELEEGLGGDADDLDDELGEFDDELDELDDEMEDLGLDDDLDLDDELEAEDVEQQTDDGGDAGEQPTETAEEGVRATDDAGDLGETTAEAGGDDATDVESGDTGGVALEAEATEADVTDELEGDGDLEGFEDAMTEADEISAFFDERSAGDIEELGEVEGFFEPGTELEQTFSEDKLSTLLSEAKQGVAEYEGLEGYVEHERYWVNKPYAYVAILYSDTQNDHLYYVVEPRLDEYEETVRRDLQERLRDVLMYEEVDEELDEEEVLEKKVKKIIRDYGIDVDTDSMHKILYYLKRDYIHDGKIDPIMRDPAIEDISCDGDNVPIFVYHRDYRDLMSNVEFDRKELDSFVIKLAQKAGKHISVADPLVDASMPDGSRIQMTLGKEVTDRGSTFTIRLFADEPFTPIDLINYSTFSLEQMAYLWTCIENNKSLIFAGGTASGKTTSMNAVTLFIPPKSKVISIEDTREVTLPHMNWIPSVTRDSFSDDGVGAVDEYELLRAALRQRPEYLVVGEVRGEEALTLFQAMSTGHTTYSTMHADSVDSAIHRLENPPISVPRSMLKALDIVSIQAQTFVKGERVRRNMKLVEIIGIDPKTRNIRTDDIFQWNAETDNFVRTGNSTALQDIKRARGWSDEELQRELDQRREVLQYMLDNDISDYEEVSKVIQSFIIDSDRVLNQIREDELDLEELSELKTLNI